MRYNLRRIMKKILLLAIIPACVALYGCAQNVSPNTYTTGEVGVVSKVKPGVIIAKRVINIDNSSGVGGVAGVGAGAAAGSMIGSRAATNIVGGVGGAVVAGVVGHQIDKAVNRHVGYEYIIKLDEDSTVAVVQEKSVQLATGQRVLVIYGAMTRVVPDETVATTTKR